MLEKLKELWQMERWFTFALAGTASGIYFLAQTIQLSGWTKLLLGLILILFLIILISGVATAAKKKTEETKEKKEIKETKEGAQLLGGIIRDVPANQRWILRNALGSDIDNLDEHGKPQRPRGYQARKPGWDFYIPYYHINLGFVDLSPQPRDPKPITVNTKDNQTAIIDWRIETLIPDGDSAIKFAVKVNGNRENFEDQKATVILNQLCSQKSQEDLTEFKPDELKKDITDPAEKQFNNEMLDLGIQARALEIKKILMPEEIRAAAEYETVTKKREKVAGSKGTELKTIIEATNADPTKIVMTDMVRDMLTNLADVLVNAFRTQQETKKGGDKK